MDWINRLNSAINYMEEHMKSEIDMEEVGRIAGCSSYHFQRMFTYMADVTLSEYIRRRRMSLAAVDLLSGEKVIDVAFSMDMILRQHLTEPLRIFMVLHLQRYLRKV